MRMTKVSVVLAMALMACDDDKAASVGDAAASSGDGLASSGDAGSPDGGAQAQALTYWGNVAPIYYNKCAKCHQADGIGSEYRLDNYEGAKKWAAAAVVATRSKKMPPSLVASDNTCGDFETNDLLTDAEIATIRDWAAGDKAEGTPVKPALPSKPQLTGGKDLKTPMFSPKAQGSAIAKFDEYRCFIVDAPTDADAFITGYDVLPGNAKIVHHVLGFVVDPERKAMNGKTNGEVMKELDDQEPGRDGWFCFGSVGGGVVVSGVPVDWAPGQGVVSYPEKMGFPLKKTDKVVVQVHYNLSVAGTAGMTDSTTVRLRTASQVDRQLAFLLPDLFLDTLATGMPAVLAPAKQSVTYTWKQTAEKSGVPAALPYVDLVAVMPHMHERGRKLTLKVGDVCQARVDRWDFNWQKFYFYKSLPRITPATSIEVTCDYDTSADTDPTLPGWGTRNEMCLTVLMVALPPR